MNNDPIETEGEPIAMTRAVARRDDAPALRDLVARMYKHLVHVEPCASKMTPPCVCGLEQLVADAVRLGCREPVRVLMPGTNEDARMANAAMTGGFVGGLVGSMVNGLVYGAAARKEARDAKPKKPCKPKRAPGTGADSGPAGPRRLGPGKGAR